MIWKLDKDGNVTPAIIKAQRGTKVGTVTVFNIGGEDYLEVSDLCNFGLFHDKFKKEVVPEIAKSLGVQFDIKTEIKKKLSE